MKIAKNTDSLIPRLSGQFILCQHSRLIPPSWQVKENPPWLLITDPDLPVMDLLFPDNRCIGWLIGYPICQNSLISSKQYVFQEHSSNKVIQFIVNSLGGRFLCVLLHNINRLYPDPGGSFPVVYSEKKLIAASSVSLIPGYEKDIDTKLMQTVGMPYTKDSWFPFGLTSVKHTSRLLPNHYLDLSLWKSKRHWPDKKTIDINEYVADGSISTIGNIIENNIHALTNYSPINMSLTAGVDTRLLLACSRELLDKIFFFTLYNKTRNSVDCHIASLLKKRWRLEHSFIKLEKAPDDYLKYFCLSTGFCVSLVKGHVNYSLRHLGKKRFLLTGMASPVSKAVYSLPGDMSIRELDPYEIIKRLGIPHKQQIIKNIQILNRAKEWLTEISHLKANTIFDLLYMEQKNGCWAAPQTLIDKNRALSNIWPCNHRKIYQLMLQLPVEYKMKYQMHTDICLKKWPELLEVPYNMFTGKKKIFNAILLLRKKLKSLKNIINTCL